MEHAQTDSVFEFVSSPLVINWNNVCRIHEIELHPTDGTSVAVRHEHILTKPSVSHLTVDLLKNRLARACRDVSDLLLDVRVGDSLQRLDLFRLLSGAV
jgi:hypothetical protein